jgi:ABC-type bacteriocin/lantibiotic exporter with double-glycine peptidase domain
MFILNNIAAAAHPLVYGWFINALQRDGTDVLKNTWMYIGGFLILRLLEWVFFGPARIMERHLAFKISKNFMEEIYHKVMHLPVKWHQDHHTGATINRVRRGYESLKDFSQNGFVYMHSLSKFLFSFAAMIYFSPLFGAIGVLLGIFTIWVIFKFDKPFVKTLKEVNEREHEVSSTLFDSLSNIMTVITLRLEKRMIFSIIGKVKRVFPSFRKNVRINEWKWFTSQMLVSLIFGITIIGYTYQNYIPGEAFFMGGLVTLLIYVNQFTSVFNDIAHQYTRIVEQHTDIQMTEEIVKTYNENHVPKNNSMLPETWKRLEINNLNFSHAESIEGKEKIITLNNVNIRIKKGQRLALIGESGSGKSTLLGILRGLHTPETGIEMIVDKKLKKDFSSICNNVTLFPQDPEIFENTILYNITLGLPFSREEVIKACDIAQFSEVANLLPNGLDSSIQEKGINLSGGQKQRLALARGILSALSSDIILLDEPTSSVDPKTEAEIYKQIFRAFEDKAIISSIHRLHLLKNFDYVYILENGKIVDQGTFKKLLKDSAAFHQLWKHQEYLLDVEIKENEINKDKIKKT